MSDDESSPLLGSNAFDGELLQRLLIESVIDPAVEVIRRRYAPFQAAYDAAFADWERMMDAPGLPDPMGTYAILNLHYPWILEEIGCVGCLYCSVAWPCRPFANLARLDCNREPT